MTETSATRRSRRCSTWPGRAHDAVLDYACGVGMTAFAVAPAVAVSASPSTSWPDALDEGRRLVAELGLDNVAFKARRPLRAALRRRRLQPGRLLAARCTACPSRWRRCTRCARVAGAGARIVVDDAVVDDVTDAAFNDLARLREPAHRRHFRAEELEALGDRRGSPRRRAAACCGAPSTSTTGCRRRRSRPRRAS